MARNGFTAELLVQIPEMKQDQVQSVYQRLSMEAETVLALERLLVGGKAKKNRT